MSAPAHSGASVSACKKRRAPSRKSVKTTTFPICLSSCEVRRPLDSAIPRAARCVRGRRPEPSSYAVTVRDLGALAKNRASPPHQVLGCVESRGKNLRAGRYLDGTETSLMGCNESHRADVQRLQRDSRAIVKFTLLRGTGACRMARNGRLKCLRVMRGPMSRRLPSV